MRTDDSLTNLSAWSFSGKQKDSGLESRLFWVIKVVREQKEERYGPIVTDVCWT